MNRLIHKQQGLSLIELMVAIVISSLLMAGTIQLFVNNNQTYRVQEAVSRLQENGRFAIQFLTQDIRMTDFWGCVGTISSVTNHLNANTYLANPGNGGISGADNTGLNGSDTIILQGAYGLGTSIASHDRSTASFTLSTVNHGLKNFDIVVSTDCEKADIFEITSANPGNSATVIGHTVPVADGPGNATIPNLTYNEGEIYKAYQYSYSIAAGASGQPALFRSTNGTNQELVEGIENMQIKYGEDTDGDGAANIYRDSGAVTDMENVVSIRITLTVRTLTDNVSLSGGRITRDFSSTITIRNRVD